MQSDRQARISQRAYQIWLEEGCVDGKQDEHWHRAEREVAQDEHNSREYGEAHATVGKPRGVPDGKPRPRSRPAAGPRNLQTSDPPSGEPSQAPPRGGRSGARGKPSSRTG